MLIVGVVGCIPSRIRFGQFVIVGIVGVIGREVNFFAIVNYNLGFGECIAVAVVGIKCNCSAG